jgi:very-short-patch-repair endonuclease
VSLEHVDLRIGLVAARQDVVITVGQLRALGLGRGAIAHRRKRGLLHPLHVGVYRWGPPGDCPWTSARAAVLACAGDSLASHHAALGLYGIRPHCRGPIDVTVVGRRVRLNGVRTHTAAALAPEDRRALRGVALTSPARALLEVAAELTSRELADAVEQAQIRRLVSKAEIAGAIARAPRRPGAHALRALLDEPAYTRSHAERKLVALLRAAALPEPIFNTDAEGFEVDALLRPQRVVLEFDSYAFHATRAAFERDRRRTAALPRGRHLVLRTTWRELTTQSHALIARIAEALALSTR